MTYSGPKIGNWSYTDLDFRTGSPAILADGANVVNGITITVRKNSLCVTNGIIAGSNGLRITIDKTTDNGGSLFVTGTGAFSSNKGSAWGSDVNMPNIGIPLAANIPALARHLSVTDTCDIQLVACFSTLSNNIWGQTGSHNWGAEHGIGLCDTVNPYGQNGSNIPYFCVHRGYDYSSDLGWYARGYQASNDGIHLLGGYDYRHIFIDHTSGILHADSQALAITMAQCWQYNPFLACGTYNGDGIIPKTLPLTMVTNLSTWQDTTNNQVAQRLSYLEANFFANFFGMQYEAPNFNYIGELEKLRVMWR